jgi:hypothetical protein
MKSKLLQLFFSAFLLSVALFVHLPTALADDDVKIIHETDNGAVINLTVGQQVQFSFDENIPSTSHWIRYIPWLNTTDSIVEGTPDLSVATVTTFPYYATKVGQTMVVFYKNAVMPSPGDPTQTVFKDEKHPLQNALIFVVNVYDAPATATK